MSARQFSRLPSGYLREPLPSYLQPDEVPPELFDAVDQICRKFRSTRAALSNRVHFDPENDRKISTDLIDFVATRCIDWILNIVGAYRLWHFDEGALRERYHYGEWGPGEIDPTLAMTCVDEMLSLARRETPSLAAFVVVTTLLRRLDPAFDAFWKTDGKEGKDLTVLATEGLEIGPDGEVVLPKKMTYYML